MSLVVVVYWPAFSFGYVNYDDPWYARDNPHVRAGLTGESIYRAFTATMTPNWQPMTWLSLMLDTTILGDHAQGHHAVNIAVHAANVLLLMGLLNLMTGMFWRSTLVAALLAVHPLHVESVAWITERKDVLSLMFALLAMLAFVRFTQRTSKWMYALSVTAFVLGLMTKPMLVTLPALLLLLDVWPLARLPLPLFGKEFWRRLGPLMFEKLPYFAFAAISAALTMQVQRVANVSDGIDVSLGQRLANAVVSHALYLGDLFWPTGLAALYPNDALIGQVMWQLWQVAAAGGLLLAITLVAAISLRHRPYLLIGWLWYLTAMMPVIGIVEIGRQSMADRFAYLPFIGLYVMLSWTIGEVMSLLPRAGRIACASLIAVGLACLATAAHRQVWVWQDSRTLFERALEVTDNNWVMRMNLAHVLEAEGDLDGAVRQYESALAIFPECFWGRIEFGMLLHRAGRLENAEREFRIAVESSPRYAKARAMLAIALSQSGHYEEAAQQMEEAIRLAPANAEQWNPLLERIQSGESVAFP